METKKFTRTIENFVCGNCSREVIGNGYTNHCPICLWSKHVDKNPGDRLEACGGMMKPSSGGKEGKYYIINHVCVKCGFSRNNKLNANDEFDAYIKL